MRYSPVGYQHKLQPSHVDCQQEMRRKKDQARENGINPFQLEINPFHLERTPPANLSNFLVY
jgi:hypothetical protein